MHFLPFLSILLKALNCKKQMAYIKSKNRFKTCQAFEVFQNLTMHVSGVSVENSCLKF